MHKLQLGLLRLRSRLRAADIADWSIALPKQGTLESGGQKSVREAINTARRNHAAIEHNKTRQIPALCSKAIGRPCPHTWPALHSKAAMEEEVGICMLGMIGYHGTD